MRVGVVGYGHLGQFLTEAILKHPELELAFVWNRSKTAFESASFDKSFVLENLEDSASKRPDLIVEVCHPDITDKVCF